jgi:hypothetical protein
MASKADIFNAALGLLGEKAVVDPDGTEVPAVKLRKVYAVALDSAIRAHPWNFAMRRAQITPDTAAPAFGFATSYTLPSDPFCVRAWRADTDGQPWKVEGRSLLTDYEGTLNLEFIARVTDASAFDPDFVLAFAHVLAALACYDVTGNGARGAQLLETSILRQREARSTDGQEGTPDEPDESQFLTARI